jgi:hypothetical protein
MTKKYLKKCSAFLDIKEMQIKTKLRFHLSPVRLLSLRPQATTNFGEDMQRNELSYTVGGNVK